MEDIQKETTPISSDNLFIVLNHPDTKFDYPVHYHSDYEINLVMNTYGERIVGDSVKKSDSLDLVMTNPNLPRAWKGEIVEGNHVVATQFSDKLLNFPILEKRLFSPIKQLLLDLQREISFSENTMLAMKEKTLQLTRIQGFHTVLEFLSILYDLSTVDRHILVSNLYGAKDTIRTSKGERITKVCDCIEKSFEEPIKLGDVVVLVNMSESAFSHFFRKRTSCAFVDYISNLHVARACQMLIETPHTVAEICYSCGFNNLSSFIRIFKKKERNTFSEYRTTLRQALIKY